jgi:hypothetical protein
MRFKSILLFTLLACGANHLYAQDLSGQWKFIASPFEGGSEEIPFTATLSTDGSVLNCHADNFFAHASKAYPADWQMKVEHADGNIRLGWVLDSENPCSTEEFQEPASKYALFGKDADTNHRYIYFLSENIETQKLEGMTLWTDWQSDITAAFTLPRTYQIYGVVSENKPYNGSVGYIDIWASGKVQFTSSTGISSISYAEDSLQIFYDLQGRRITQPTRGLYILNGKKYLKR